MPPTDLPRLSRRHRETSKRDYGRVVVVGGAAGMAGAPALAAMAALRSGAGLVEALVPEHVATIAAGFDPCVMTRGLPGRIDDTFATAALDYLVKPVDPERLADTVARVHKQVAGTSGTDDPEADEADDAEVLGLDAAVSVPLAGKTTSLVVTVGDICWIESLRNYTRVALKSPHGLLLFCRRLSQWDTILPTDLFARVGRSHIVQVATVNQIEWKSRNETVVTFEEGAAPLTLGRVAAKRLREILTGDS